MSNSTPLTKMTSECHPASQSRIVFFTYWNLYERAVEEKYGRGIIISQSPFYKNLVDNLDFDISILADQSEPREATRTIVDINTKEYINRGTQGHDESIVKVLKNSTKNTKDRYSFYTLSGIQFGYNSYDVGAIVKKAAILGVGARFSMSLGSKTESEGEAVSFTFEQEEKITVPPGTLVKAKITTYSIRYEKDYTIKLSIDRNASLPVLYTTQCQQTVSCGLWKSTGSVLVRDIISVLPNYNEYDENSMVSFTQVGTLSWVGEGCNVDKEEQPLQFS